MNKSIYFSLIILLGLLITAAQKKPIKRNYLSGTYFWSWTMEENIVMLIRKKATDSLSSGQNHIKFGKTSFRDLRLPPYGNDIRYDRTGYYYFTSTKFILNYKKGYLTDNVGADSIQRYVRGPVYFSVIRKNGDTILLRKTSGNSIKKVARK